MQFTTVTLAPIKEDEPTEIELTTATGFEEEGGVSHCYLAVFLLQLLTPPSLALVTHQRRTSPSLSTTLSRRIPHSKPQPPSWMGLSSRFPLFHAPAGKLS